MSICTSSITALIFALSLLFLATSIAAQRIPKCGVRLTEPIQPQSVQNGGIRPMIEQWPWVGTLFIRFESDPPVFVCLVTILNDRFVLTAGYCLTSTRHEVEASDLAVRIRMDSFDRNRHEFKVDEFHISNSTDPLAALALLRLMSEINLNLFASPVCLWERDVAEQEFVGKNGSLVGWKSNLSGALEKNMRILNMVVVPSSTCPVRQNVMTEKFCTKVLDDITYGHGDGGGGFYYEEEGKWYVRGIIVKFSVIELEEQYLSFADVTRQIKWIRNIIE
ncbi:CLIP domain-containing serine protease B4-like [Armigeres subalbatus]|uniref:CLIP domain-containing serine protease B4-like n=1 Tax=Armigeres subalbatus TaxID=124917 RepID=UPI002ED22CE1